MALLTDHEWEEREYKKVQNLIKQAEFRQQACLMGIKTKYTLTSRLFNKLKLAKVDGTYNKELNKIVKTNLLILDDFGLQAFDNHAREAFRIGDSL